VEILLSIVAVITPPPIPPYPPIQQFAWHYSPIIDNVIINSKYSTCTVSIFVFLPLLPANEAHVTWHSLIKPRISLPPPQRVLNDIHRTRLSCGSMIRLPPPPTRQQLFFSFSVILSVAGRAYWRGRGWVWSQIIRPLESLVLCK
jgi:hypothetical protein